MDTINAKELITKFLNGRPWLMKRNVKIINEENGVISSLIDGALAKFGACATVHSWTTEAKSDASRTAVCESKLVVNIFEMPLKNRSQAMYGTAEAIALYIAGRLNLQPLKQNDKDPSEEELLLAKPQIREGPAWEGLETKTLVMTAQTTIPSQDD
jgi:hypothetical protein